MDDFRIINKTPQCVSARYNSRGECEGVLVLYSTAHKIKQKLEQRNINIRLKLKSA